jgi:hypothetical protein
MCLCAACEAACSCVARQLCADHEAASAARSTTLSVYAHSAEQRGHVEARNWMQAHVTVACTATLERMQRRRQPSQPETLWSLSGHSLVTLWSHRRAHAAMYCCAHTVGCRRSRGWASRSSSAAQWQATAQPQRTNRQQLQQQVTAPAVSTLLLIAAATVQQVAHTGASCSNAAALQPGLVCAIRNQHRNGPVYGPTQACSRLPAAQLSHSAGKHGASLQQLH